jgi:hypothetical protein
MIGGACRGQAGKLRSRFLLERGWSWKDTSKMKAGQNNSGRVRELLLEEIFEGLACVGRTAVGRLWNGCGDLRGLLIGSGRGVLFDGGAEFIKFAVVLAVFGSDTFGDRLRTFKLSAGIEEAALFAAVEFSVAFGAGAGGIESGDEHCAAIGAAGASDGSNHARSARAQMIVLSAGSALRGFTFGA